MKRALAVFSVLAVLGFSAFGIGTFSGKWEATIQLLPTPTQLTANKLTLNYTDFGWTFTGVLSLLGAPTDTFDISAKGAFGPFSINGTMKFDFTPAYKGAKLVTSLDFAGLGLSFEAYHGAAYVTDVGCQTPAQSLKYVLKGKVDPISVTLTFRDCCTGTEFYSAKITLKGLGLCCGISLDAELYFTKADGFKYLSFSGIEIPLCCGVSLTAGVTFTTSGKQLTTGLKWGGVADTCFTVYGDAIGGKDGEIVTENPTEWLGIEIYGWKIRCSLGDCNYVEFLTALEPDADVFSGIFAPNSNEFEYMKLGFCGAGCCGGKYTVDLSVYFNNGGGLFGISRLGANMSIPVMSNFTVNVSFSAPDTALSVGWVFTF